MRTGIATVPLDYGKCPYWLFERMKKLSRGIVLAIVEEFGPDEILKRLSNPVWFQSLGCVLGFDWNSSGLATTTLGALKEGVRGLESNLGLFICGGKGKTSRKTPEQIQDWGEFLGYSLEKIDSLIYASKISAKVDNNAIQDGFQLYHHNLIFSKSGQWTVIQQGMNEQISQARRYHWGSPPDFFQKFEGYDFVEEPHSGIISDIRLKPLNLTAKESKENKEVSAGLVREEPKRFLKSIKLISEKPKTLMNYPVLKGRGIPFGASYFSGFHPRPKGRDIPAAKIKQKRIKNFTEIELNNVEFYWHPVVNEKFNLKRLEKTIFFANQQNPKNFEELLSLKGVGPKTIRALSLVSEIIYGAKPSYEDPARYTFAHGGKDGTPYFVEKDTYDKTIAAIEKGIRISKISQKEKLQALKRLNSKK